MKIKFPRTYAKLKTSTGKLVKLATLREVFVASDLTESFLDYNEDADAEVLPPDSRYIVLLFSKEPQHVHRDLFTVLRWWSHEKEEYYRGLIGNIFEVDVKTAEET